ncbi:MAG: FkbM family methyltransferase [Gammaproteobacteria bacterium]|nr:MAG: FkbM family methyltransferase [Gammaproteobacteria bacterium]
MRKTPQPLNKLAQFVQCHNVLGKYRFYELTKHIFNRRLITYKIAGKEFSIPWDQWCFWLNGGPENYYLDEIIPFTRVLNAELQQFIFFDLGADVGVVSALVNKYCTNLNQIIAIEPNPISFSVLKENLLNIAIKHRALKLAISNFNGYADFSFNAQQGSDHEGHLVITSNEKTNTQVITLDSLIAKNNIKVTANIAIKIDIEGQEKAFFAGAHNTIKSVKKVVVLLELHPDVLTRDKQTPEEIFAEAEKVRNFRWLVPLHNNKLVDRTLNFYDQFPLQQYDVIGIAD